MLKTSLGTIIRWYKGRCAFEIHKTQNNFAWQPRFYDHIIRNEESLDKIRFYVRYNARKWKEDEYNPQNLPKGSNIFDGHQSGKEKEESEAEIVG